MGNGIYRELRCRRRCLRSAGLLAAVALIAALGRPGLAAAADTDAVRGYLGIRIGGALLLDDDLNPHIEGSMLQQLVGVGLGVNLGRHLSLELAGDGYELNLKLHGLPRGNTVAEYAIYTVVPQLRLRYPLREGRLTPYALAGVGVSFTEINDQKEPVFDFDIDIDGNTWDVVGALGAVWSISWPPTSPSGWRPST